MIIYKSTNKTNGMSYIGQTIFTLNERKVKHERKDDKSYFQHAIEKHGKDNFEWEVLCECSSSKEMNEMEINYIKEHNTLRPNGYNLTKGGEGSFWTGENNPAKLDHIRKKISEALKGRKNLEIARRNKENTGKTYEEIYGEDRALEIKQKMTLTRTGKPLKYKRLDESNQKQRDKMCKYVYTLRDVDGQEYIYNSLRLACIELKFNRSSLMHCFRKGLTTHKGWTINRELI
jgi:group I intron endonuclease